MPQQYANAFAGPNLAAIDESAYRNDLLANERNRLPQYNRQQDQQIEAQDLAVSSQQRQNARGVLANRFAAVATSARPRDAARAFIGGAEFQAAGKLLGLPVEQFQITDADDDASVQAQARDWAQALGAASTDQQQQRVQSTFSGRNGNQWIVTSDGRTIDTGVPVSQFAQRPVEAAGALVPFDPASGRAGAPIATAAQQVGAAADLKRAETEAAASVVPADARAAAAAKSPRLAAAERRLERLEAASLALGARGGPIEGRVQGFIGTEAAQELEAASAQLLTELTALTRIPGVGSQSDLEQRLANLQLPNATQHPAVRERSIQELRAFIADLNSAVGSVAQPARPPTNGGWSIVEVK